MELKNRSCYDFKGIKKDADQEEKHYENYSFHMDGEHLHALQDEKERILHDENIENTKRKRKRKKKRPQMQITDMLNTTDLDNDKSIAETTAVSSTMPNEARGMDKQGHLPLNSLGSREKLQKIKEEFCNEDKQSTKVDIRQQALQQAMNQADKDKNEKRKHNDYVLVYKTGDSSNTQERLREIFEVALEEEGFRIEKKYSTLHTFVLLHCPFERLCIEAEYVILQMPLAGYVVPEQIGERSWLSKLEDKFKTDNEVDFVSAPFCLSKKEIYEGIKDPDTFFRPALRSLLVNHILITIDIRDKESRQLGQNPQGLPYMLMEGAYSDAFILHEKSKYDQKFPLLEENEVEETFLYGQDVTDPRRSLHNTWTKWVKFQPLWKIRNYFGEKIALYFAWLGSMAFSLVFPVLFGLAVFLWGLIVATNKWYDAIHLIPSVNDHPVNQVNTTISNVISRWAKNAFDNSVTPYFALVICLWGTIFLETWKRLNAKLAYQWDVDDFEEQEPNRPEFYGTQIRPDPVTGQHESFYPFKKRFAKMIGSFSLLLFMVCLVLASLFAVIVYRIIAREDLFKSEGALGPTIASITSTFLNTCSIMIMGKVYQLLAVRLTDWENHRTRTSYDDALIIKLFGFQFVNSYTSLFYIAFFRQDTASEGVLGFGQNYNDACGSNNDCMTLLSLQVAMLMIMKPLPKLLSDIMLPFVKRLWRQCCTSNNKVNEADEVNHEMEDFLTCELQKEPLGDFTLSEYTEKVLQYGFLMLFAAAFPLAPLIALLTNLIDVKVDARRLLWVNRRPIAYRAQDIGIWYGILEFLNIVGVVTNGFLVTFTSDYGKHWEGYTTSGITNQTLVDPVTNQTIVQLTIKQQPTFSRLWLLIGFEHIVFAIKFLIAWIIPDVPNNVRVAQRREKHHIADILAKSGVRKGPGKKLTESSSIYRRPLRTSQSSPVILTTHQKSDQQPRETGASSSLDKKHLIDTAPETKRRQVNHVTSRTILDPLPVSYLWKFNKNQIGSNDKVV